jgi:hypothetical protein
MGRLIRRTAMLAFATGFCLGGVGFATAAPPSAVNDCNATFKACVASCGKTKKCTAQCGGPWEQCMNSALTTKPPKGLRKKPPR